MAINAEGEHKKDVTVYFKNSHTTSMILVNWKTQLKIFYYFHLLILSC